MAALSGALELRERLDALLEWHTRVGRVKLIEPDLIDAQSPQALFAGLANVLRRAVACPIAAWPPHSGFRRDFDSIAIGPIANCRGD